MVAGVAVCRSLHAPLPPNAEVAVRANVEPILLKGGGTVKSVSVAFLPSWKKTGVTTAIVPWRAQQAAGSIDQDNGSILYAHIDGAGRLSTLACLTGAKAHMFLTTFRD